MEEDELAKTIAALVLSTKNKNKLEKIETAVPQYMKDLNRKSLYTKVNHYLTHPPDDNFDSLAAQTPSRTIIHPCFNALAYIKDRRTRGLIGSRPTNIVKSF
jgi:hypothetical protein